MLRIALIGLIRLYQLAISPFLGERCRFYPNCSAYCREALEQHGIMNGLKLTFFRLLRCHPWHAGGMDPVPPKRGK